MKLVFQKIWDLAKPYQDKRDDDGHAKTVLEFAEKLLKNISANDDIVIPAAILHDVGWSKISKENRMKIFQDNVSSEEKLKLRFIHEKEGAKLAQEILYQVNYDDVLSEEIIKIIDGHDTRKFFLSKEDGIVRDADRLSIFSKWGVDSDLSIRKDMNPRQYLDILENKLHKKYKFYYQKSKQMAFEELKNRKKEYL